MGVLEEQNGVVLGVSWSLPSGLAPVIGVHQMNTSCHTLAADMIKWVWLDILYLHVLYVAIGAPPPLVSVLHFIGEKFYYSYRRAWLCR